MRGRLVSLIEGKHEQLLTVAVKADFRERFDELHETDVEIEIEKHREKRSRNANSYCWVLCEKIADVIGSTKTEVYQNAIRDVGVWRDVPDLGDVEATFRRAWENQGIGWLTEDVGNVTRFYYGSSVYNSKQMSRLLSNLVQDAQGCGIVTETPDEIAKMISLWGEKKEKEK